MANICLKFLRISFIFFILEFNFLNSLYNFWMFAVLSPYLLSRYSRGILPPISLLFITDKVREFKLIHLIFYSQWLSESYPWPSSLSNRRMWSIVTSIVLSLVEVSATLLLYSPSLLWSFCHLNFYHLIMASKSGVTLRLCWTRRKYSLGLAPINLFSLISASLLALWGWFIGISHSYIPLFTC